MDSASTERAKMDNPSLKDPVDIIVDRVNQALAELSGRISQPDDADYGYYDED